MLTDGRTDDGRKVITIAHPEQSSGELKLTINGQFYPYIIYTGVRLQGDWGEIVALEGSKLPWEALRATKTSPSIFATFEKANTCAKRTFYLEKSSKN